MFENVLNYLAKQNLYSEKVLDLLDSFSKKLDSFTPEVKEKMNLVKHTIQERPDLEYIEMYFWMERYQFSVNAQDEAEILPGTSIIWDDQVQFYSLLSSFKIHEEEEEEREIAFNLAFKMYYTWLGFLWQACKLYECHQPMSIEVNSDIITYYFNDFLKGDFSSFDQSCYEIGQKGRPFTRDLSVEEIFIRNYFINHSAGEITLIAKKDKEYCELTINKNIFQFYQKTENLTKELIEQKEFKETRRYSEVKGTTLEYFIVKMNTLINENWYFQLESCTKNIKK